MENFNIICRVVFIWQIKEIFCALSHPWNLEGE